MSYNDSAFYVAETNRKNRLKASLKPFVGILSGRNAPLIKSNDKNRFDNRLNFFLIFESVLLGVVGTLYSKSASAKPILITIICLGFFLTVLWGYIQAREKFLFEGVEKRLKEVAPEYGEVVFRREQIRWPLQSTPLLTYWVPAIVALVWAVFFVFAAR